jgi:flagellar hook-length control protein FliK
MAAARLGLWFNALILRRFFGQPLGPPFADQVANRSCAFERPAVASVAADPSAIAPPPPLPTRSDAAPTAGPSSAFADLLDGTTASTSAVTNTGQNGAPAGSGTASAAPAGTSAAAAGIRNGNHNSKDDTNDPTTARDAGSATVDVTLVAALLLPPAPLAASPNANQTPAAVQDPQSASGDATPAIGSDASDKPNDRKDASADVVPAGLVATLPNLIPITVSAAVATSSTSASTSPVASSPVAPLQSEVFSGPSSSAPALGNDVGTSSASAQQTTDATANGSPGSPSAAPDLLPAVPSALSALSSTDALQTAVAVRAVAGAAASDPSERAASATPPVAPSGASAPLAPLASFSPTPAAFAEIHLADQSAGGAEAPRVAESTPIALSAPIVVRLAASVRGDDGNTSDGGTDALFGFAGGDVGGTTAGMSSAPAGAMVAPSFNPTVPLVQGASAPPMASQHTGVMNDAVPLAGIPIAIVAHAEAGEKRFEIRLDPPDLGRIEVQLNVDSSGRATSHLIVDRADTLDLLRRDAPALERALQSAGLTTDQGALQFSLRDQAFAGRDQGAPATIIAPAGTADSDPAPIDTALRRYGPPMGLGGGIDIRV